MRAVMFLLFVFCAEILAQSGKLEGKIIDETGSPVAYATVQITELKYGVSTDAEGFFSFGEIAPGNYTLLISHVGYATVEKKITIKESGHELIINMRKTPVTLGEAVVVAARSPQDEKTFSLPVETVTEKNFEQKIPNSIADALNEKAGVSVARDGAWGTMLNVRGLSKQNLVYLIDGARIETSTNIAGGLSLFDLNDIEKAEVVKGGLSSLYGTGATGGVVNIVSKKARFSNTPYLRGKISGGYQTVNKSYLTGINIFAGSENLKAKISASTRKADDVKIPDGYLENSAFKDYAYSLSIGYLPYESFEVGADFQKYKATDVGIPGGAAFPPNAKATYPEAGRELFSAYAIWRNPLKAVTSVSVKYYNQWIRRIVEIIPTPGKSVNPSSDQRTNGITLQAESAIGNHYLIYGADIWERNYKGVRITRNEAADVTIFDKPVPNSTFASRGFFMRDNFSITEKFNVTVGGRYDFIQISNEETENPIYKIVAGDTLHPSPIPDASFPASKTDNASWSGNLNVLYKFSRKLNFIVSAAKTFRSPSLEERYQYINLGGIVYLGNPELKPEKGTAFDFGVRYYGERFSAKGNFFLNYFNDLVIDSPEPYDSTITKYKKTNVGESRFYGFDLTLQAQICKALLTGTLAYVNARDTKNDAPLPQIPPLNASLEITAPVLNLFDFTVRGSFSADKNDVPESETRTPGYAVYDFEIKSKNINLGSAELKIYVGIENVLNRKYRNHLSTYRGISLTEPGRNIYLKFFIGV